MSPDSNSPQREATAIDTRALPPLPSNLDTVRGIACMLIVAFHVVGLDPTRGLRLPDGSYWHYATATFDLVRLPIFTALSGYLYARRPPTAESFTMFWRKKLRRIAIPLVSLTILTLVARNMIGAEKKSIWLALGTSYEHLWFLQALLVLFLLASIWHVLRPPTALSLVMVIAALVLIRPLQPITTEWFSLRGAVFLSPFFCWGMLIAQRQQWLLSSLAGAVALTLTLLALAYQQAGLWGYVEPSARVSIVAAVARIGAVTALLVFMPRVPAIDRVGVRSYPIYLWHVIFLAACRLALWAAGVESTIVLFVAGLIAGIYGPILLRWLIRPVPYALALLMGEQRNATARRESYAPAPALPGPAPRS